MAELLSNTVEMIKPLDEGAMSEARARQDILTKPPGSLGRLEELSIQLAGVQAKPVPQIKHKAIITMAGDHGVVAEGVGNWPGGYSADGSQLPPWRGRNQCHCSPSRRQNCCG